MPSCPHCLEEIKVGARKCPHCQTSLEPASGAEDATVYILDKGLLRFGKFAVGVLAIFVLVGTYWFGFDIKEASKKTSEAEIQVQKALLEVERERAALDAKISASERTVARIEALEHEIASHRDATQRSVKEATQLVLDIRGRSEEASKLILEFPKLEKNEVSVALAKREEKGIKAARGKLWKNGSTLTFRFLNGEEQQKTIVRLAISQWAENVNLTFKEIDSGETDIRISFKEMGSWSYIGTDALGISQDQPTLNYDTLANLTDLNAAMRSALHEFGHALGLAHEFQSPYAGEIFDRAATVAFYSAAPYVWDKSTIEENVFGKNVEYPGKRTYDPESIMNNSFPRELFLPGKETRPGNGLSKSDKSYVASLYPRN
jgi:serralysin